MTAQEVLEKVHVRYEGDTSYPTSTEEDFIVRLAHLDDATDTIEQEAKQGVVYPFLVAQASITAGGTGTDALETDHLSFVTDYLKAGDAEYRKVSKEDGNRYEQDGLAPYVFWQEGTNLRSLPALSGTVTFPYQRKLTRFTTGDETDDVDGDPKYYQEFVLAMLYLDDGDLNQYNVHANNAKDILQLMKHEAIVGESAVKFPFGA
jgi:hypothetical protein